MIRQEKGIRWRPAPLVPRANPSEAILSQRHQEVAPGLKITRILTNEGVFSFRGKNEEKEDENEQFVQLTLTGEKAEQEDARTGILTIQNPETGEIEEQYGRVVGEVMETRKFRWEHLAVETGAVIGTVGLGVVLHSLYKHIRNSHE